MLSGDDRGQSIQLGAILLFGLLVIGLAVSQTVVVPAENGGVEFNSYTEATSDLVSLENDVVAAGTQGGQPSTNVRTGVRYPSRAVLLNPGPPVGSIGTTPSVNVTVDGVEAVSGEEHNVRGFWNTSMHGARNYSTRSVVFSPRYNEIDVPSIEVSGQGTYRRTENGPLALTGRTFLSGNRITLVTVDGDVGRAGFSTSVQSTPVSVATRAVTVTGSGSEFVVTLPVPGNGTVAAATQWNGSSVADELRSNPHVLGTEVDGSRVDVVFDGTRQYELRLARVIVHDSGDSGVDSTVEPAYLVAVEGNGSDVPATGARRVAVEARDRYNNPVAGVPVSFSTAGGNFTATGGGTATVVTGSDGRAATSVDPNRSTVVVDASFPDGEAPYNATSLTLAASAGGGSLEEINSGVGGVTMERAEQGSPKRIADVYLNNTGEENRTVTDVRVSFYFAEQNTDIPDSYDLRTDGESVATGEAIGGPFVALSSPVRVVAGEETKLTFEFAGASNVQTREDFFVLSVRYETLGRVTYFVSVKA
jgi:hypothetical protein